MNPRLPSSRMVAALILFVAFFFGCGGGQADTHAGTPQKRVASTPSGASAAPVATQTPPAADAGASPAASAAPQAAWKPLLFKIGGAKPSYLFGTIHIPDPRLATLPPGLAKAIDDSDEIVNEMPLDDATLADTVAAAKMPPGARLSTSISPALYERLKRAFESKGAGAAMPFLDGFKVWAVAVQVALLDHLQDLANSKGIDSVIHDRGAGAKKRTTGLETAAEQIAVFDRLTKDEQARVLEQALDERDNNIKDGKDPVVALMNLYVAGDEAPLLAELNHGFDLKRPLDQKLIQRLILDRNKIMADRIDAKIKSAPPRSYFVAIGAAHLLGGDGVVAQLKKKGYVIERVQ